MLTLTITAKRRLLLAMASAPVALSLLFSVPCLFELVSTKRPPTELLGAQPHLLIPYVCASMATSNANAIMLLALEIAVRLLCGLVTLGLLWQTFGKYGVLRLIIGTIALNAFAYCLVVYAIVKLLAATTLFALLPVLVICVAANVCLLARFIQLLRPASSVRQ